MNRLTIRIALYVAVCVTDLLATILIVQSGRGIEANPIAARFAHDPVQLILFKTAITGLIILVATRLARLHRQLAETAMAAACAVTMFAVACGLATVAPLR